MGSQAAQVRVERSGGQSPAMAGRALKVVPTPAVSPREGLRAAVLERLQRDTTGLLERMSEFLDKESRAGVASIGQVISVTAVAQDLWAKPRQLPEARAHLARAFGLAPDVGEAVLVRALLTEVSQAFTAFENSAAGRDFRERYDALLWRCESLSVLPIVLGFDVSPMLGELVRLGLQELSEYGRSLLLDPRVLAVMPPTPELPEEQAWVSGVSVSQLALVVVQMRQHNPILSNRQARNLFRRCLSDGSRRISLGRAEMDRLQDWSRHLLRLQAVGRLAV